MIITDYNYNITRSKNSDKYLLNLMNYIESTIEHKSLKNNIIELVNTTKKITIADTLNLIVIIRMKSITGVIWIRSTGEKSI